MPSEKLPYVYERIDPSDYSYDLPSGRIARLPASNRAMSNLLVADVATGQIDHRQFCDVPTLLEPGTLIVRNNTKVIPARLFLRRKSGARIEVLLLEPSEAGSVNAESVGLHNGVLATKWTAKVRRLKRLVDKEELDRGMVLCKPGTVTPHTKFTAQVYVLSKDEGGRHTPFFNGYRPQFYFRTTDVTGVLNLPAGTEMVMPGDNIDEIDVALDKPIAMEEGLRFAVREGGRTVGAGIVTKIVE